MNTSGDTGFRLRSQQLVSGCTDSASGCLVSKLEGGDVVSARRVSVTGVVLRLIVTRASNLVVQLVKALELLITSVPSRVSTCDAMAQLVFVSPIARLEVVGLVCLRGIKSTCCGGPSTRVKRFVWKTA